ncbi:ATP-grasp domain-containing protein [Actinospica durhamensis]|uniref:ATP-grasp domain-containing protein n=1 Tax=Actinospica durhamensis TaxID=1508375 RepID=A0A941IP28_9ACTN|nr:ATP-grasp domain-containing protein [Actinospica durhamensis]MBR7834644.1 ATP-grasp domain-containing protein [Actinospica durhamensis]
MSNAKRVIVVGGGPGLCDRVRLLGAAVTLVEPPGHYDADLVALAERSVLTSYDDPALIPMLAAIHRETPFSAVLSLTELGLLPAAKIAQELGVPGLSPETVGRTRDKFAMRQWLRDQGFSKTPCALVRDAADIRAFANEHGYPVIVKPRHGQGSEHVSCFRRPEDVLAPAEAGDEYIAEPFLDGPEFSVEAFSRAGAHHVIAITGKLTQDDDPENPFVEIGHVVPAPIAPEAATAITQYVAGFLGAMGITDGVSHTELRLTASGPEVVETHTRVGGDSIPTLVRQATGYDLLDLAAQWPLEPDRPYQPAPTTAGAAAIRFFTPPPGTVLGVSGVQRWQGLPGVLKLHLPLAAGDEIPAIRDSHTRVGYVLAAAASAEQALEVCRQVISGVRIDVRR